MPVLNSEYCLDVNLSIGVSHRHLFLYSVPNGTEDLIVDLFLPTFYPYGIISTPKVIVNLYSFDKTKVEPFVLSIPENKYYNKIFRLSIINHFFYNCP